jgi:tetratricopeptide (TPR) repeat protein
MSRLAILLILPVWAVAQPPGAATTNTQTSSGSCSPTIVGSGNGPITVQLPGCAVDPQSEKRLIGLVEKFFAQFPDARRNQATIDNLNELLIVSKTELANKVQEVEEWTTKYRELSDRLAVQPADDELSKQAADALKKGNLGRAESLLKDLLAKDEKQVERVARNHFNLGSVYNLQFEPLLALPEYEQAYRYSPQRFEFAAEYARLLQIENRYTQAEAVYLVALRIVRGLAATDVRYFSDVAWTLNKMGILYRDTQRLKEAEATFTECLTIRRQLAKENAAYLPDVVATLNNLGILYRDTQRLQEAEGAYTECLTAYRQLAKENAAAYLPDVARTLNNLGILYRDT